MKINTSDGRLFAHGLLCCEVARQQVKSFPSSLHHKSWYNYFYKKPFYNKNRVRKTGKTNPVQKTGKICNKLEQKYYNYKEIYIHTFSVNGFNFIHFCPKFSKCVLYEWSLHHRHSLSGAEHRLAEEIIIIIPLCHNQ